MKQAETNQTQANRIPATRDLPQLDCLTVENPLPLPEAAVAEQPSEGDWAHHYLGDTRGSIPEHAWPLGASPTKSGEVAGMPAVLTVGSLIDRFALSDGRIFAPEGTNFAQRSLPAGHLLAGYRRYLVTKALPVWRASVAGQSAGGVRYRSALPVAELLTAGYLKEVTNESKIVTS